MGPVDALKLALSKEEEAIEVYTKLSCDHPVVKEVLAFLINEEEKHKKLIETKISELTRY